MSRPLPLLPCRRSRSPGRAIRTGGALFAFVAAPLFAKVEAVPISADFSK